MNKVKIKRILVWGVALLCVLFIVAKIWSSRDDNISIYSLIGSSAPKFDLPVIGSGGTFRFEPASVNSPIIINLWNPNCSECLTYIKQFKTIKLHSEKLLIIGLAYKTSTSEVNNWLRDNKNPFDILLDDHEGAVAEKYRFLGLPESIIINKSGKIVYFDYDWETPKLANYIENNANKLNQD